MVKKTTLQLDSISYFFLFGIVMSMLLFNNGFYLFLCLFIFLLLFFYTQQPYRIGVFTLLLFQHILQIISSVFQANYLGQNINYRSYENSTAILLSLVGLLCLFIPILYFQNKLPKVNFEKLKQSSGFLSIDKSMYFYIAAFFITSSLTSIAFVFPGLTQIIISIVKIKWLFFLLFGYLCLIKKERKYLLYLFIFLEFIIGFYSYFSDFKTVIYYLLILLVTFIVTINFKNIVYAMLIGVGLIFFALGWTRVKGDYRSFLNAGQNQQTVSVSRDEALNKLYDLSNNARENNSESSVNELIDRIQYTFHFAKTIERVPSIIAYQNGSNLLDVLQFATTPRFLNPDKPTIDNSVKTTRYTGIRYAGAKKGVSFSLGYFAECYIDFGYWGMMIPLLLIGIFYGKLYHYFITKASPNLLLNYAIAGSFFMEFYAYEMDATYLVGRLFASTLIYFLLIKFVFPIIYKSLLKNKF